MGDSKTASEEQTIAPVSELKFVKWLEEVLGSVEVEETDQTLEKLIGIANDRDLLVNNLCQVETSAGKHWRANVRSREGDFFEFGQGRTPRIAFARALYNADVTKRFSHMMAKKKWRREVD